MGHGLFVCANHSVTTPGVSSAATSGAYLPLHRKAATSLNKSCIPFYTVCLFNTRNSIHVHYSTQFASSRIHHLFSAMEHLLTGIGHLLCEAQGLEHDLERCICNYGTYLDCIHADSFCLATFGVSITLYGDSANAYMHMHFSLDPLPPGYPCLSALSQPILTTVARLAPGRRRWVRYNRQGANRGRPSET